jgi:hypothetical protein
MADPSDILTRRIREQHICTLILPLCDAFEPASRLRKSSEISFIIDRNQKINIFGVSFGTEERAEHCDTPYTRDTNDSLNKPKRFGNEKRSNIFVTRLHLNQIQVYYMV